MNGAGSFRLLAIRRWALWSTPTGARAFILTVDVLALVCGVVAVAYRSAQPGIALLPLLLCAAVAIEGARRVERVRRLDGTLHKDLQAAWSLAAALILPAGIAVLVAVVMFGWWRFRAGRCRAFTWVFSSSMTVLAVLASGAVFHWTSVLVDNGPLPDDLMVPLPVLAAGVVYELVDVVLCAAVIRLLAPDASRAETIGDRATAAIDAAALTFGGLVAILAIFNPWAMLLAVPAVVLLQRVLLVDQLAEEARTDAKTGLAVAGWWHSQATAELDRARVRNGQLAVLVADLDHFKQINDAYGHLVGDEALREVGGAVRANIRGQDLAGRFGGEEFVVALPETDAQRAALVAERLRDRVARLQVASRRDDPDAVPVRGLTVSIGVALYPEHADTLDSLLRVADQALYAAKTSGRDRVMLAAVPEIPQQAAS
ncbi:MAG: GGDEF domain-containing protein [Actinocatenispora sp.]